MHFADRLATLHHRSERASGPRDRGKCRYRRATVGHSGRVRRVGILAVAVLALAVGAIVLVATSGGSRSPAVDLRGVDRENASVPAAICGGEGAIRLHEGVALVSSRRWTDDWQGNATTEVPGQVEVWSYGDEVYGDIDGDGRNEAVVPLWCTNGGGVAPI
jgi:hypothetical protein